MLTSQNAKIYKYGDQTITPEQITYIMTGNRRAFWEQINEAQHPFQFHNPARDLSLNNHCLYGIKWLHTVIY